MPDAKRGRGGARTGAGRKRSVGATQQIPAKASPEQIARWKAAAVRKKMTFAAWVRQALDAATEVGSGEEGSDEA